MQNPKIINIIMKNIKIIIYYLSIKHFFKSHIFYIYLIIKLKFFSNVYKLTNLYK